MNDDQQAFRNLTDTLASLGETALRIKAERDEAVKLLREALLYSATGKSGPFKTKVREFLVRMT